MFPLNIVLLPGETKVLHIFEARYRELVTDCLANQANFGIPYIKGDQLADHGIEVSIIRIMQDSPEGEMDIEIKAIKPFKILKYTSVLKPKLYGAAYTEDYEDDTTSNRYKLFRSFKKLIKAAKGKEIPVETLINVSVYKVAQLLDLTNEEKLQLLAFDVIKDKEDFLIAKIKLYMHMVKLEKEIKNNFRLN
jgi:ATP-dependent Lon protease